jgi:ferritin-like metal-binding protein YciE
LSNLAQFHNAESRIAMALSKMNKAGISADLKMEILSHLKETESNITGVEEIYSHLNEQAGQDHPESSASDGRERSRDLVLNSSLKSSHGAGPPNNGYQHAWESASYECLQEWDALSGSVDAANLLESIIEDEKNEAPVDDLT